MSFMDMTFCADSSSCANDECRRHMVHLRHNYQNFPVSVGYLKKLEPHTVKGGWTEDNQWDDDKDVVIPPCGWQEVTTPLMPGDTVVFKGRKHLKREDLDKSEWVEDIKHTVVKTKKTVCWTTYWDPDRVANGRRGWWVLRKGARYSDLHKVGTTVLTPPSEKAEGA